MLTQREEVAAFAGRIKGLGFRVFIAKAGTYGFITDASGSRVLSFSLTGNGLSGNYGPPSATSGTGWRVDKSPSDLRTADDVREALYAYPPPWTGNGWKHMTTVAQHLASYGSSSKYEEFQP